MHTRTRTRARTGAHAHTGARTHAKAMRVCSTMTYSVSPVGLAGSHCTPSSYCWTVLAVHVMQQARPKPDLF
eukprot:869993-Pleurochrysis_carterae.AAC.1